MRATFATVLVSVLLASSFACPSGATTLMPMPFAYDCETSETSRPAYEIRIRRCVGEEGKTRRKWSEFSFRRADERIDTSTYGLPRGSVQYVYWWTTDGAQADGRPRGAFVRRSMEYLRDKGFRRFFYLSDPDDELRRF